NGVELAIEPMHVTPRHAFKKAVLCEDAHVLGEIGMIDAARLQVEHLGRKQCSQSNGAGRADDNFSEFFPLYVIQHLKNGREAQFLQLVLRQFKFADRLEVFNRDVRNFQITARSYDNKLLSLGGSGGGHFANGSRYAVNVLESVGEPGAFTVLQG